MLEYRRSRLGLLGPAGYVNVDRLYAAAADDDDFVVVACERNVGLSFNGLAIERCLALRVQI